MTFDRNREATSINQPHDFRRELLDRVRRCVPEYGPADVDLSTTSLQFTTSYEQPSAATAGDLRSGGLEDILRFIFQQRSCTRPVVDQFPLQVVRRV